MSIRSRKGLPLSDVKTLRCASAIEVLSHASSSRLQQPLTADPLEIFLQGMPSDEATPNRSGKVNKPGRTMTLQMSSRSKPQTGVA
jgi:hypothetical protein